MEHTHELVVMLLAAVLTAVPAGAAVRTWDGPASGNWATTANWNPDGYLTSDNLTVFSGSPTSTGNVYADYGGRITLNGLPAVANFSAKLYIGYTYGTSGWLDVLNGADVSNTSGYLGYDIGSSGTATVSGAGSTWTNSGDLRVGYEDTGTGTLTVENGGTVNAKMLWAAGSDLKGNGTINVKGLVSDIDLVFDAAHGTNPVSSFGTGGTLNLSLDGTCSLGAGYRGTASITVADGVKIVSPDGYLGYNSGSTGTATVSGAGSTWTNSNLYIGRSGTGMLTITNRGEVSNNTFGYVGRYSGSSGTATVSGAGSKWTNSYELYVGYSGRGMLAILDGGAVSNMYGFLGYGSGSSGAATVSGAGSKWTNSYELCVGGAGTGTLDIASGGAVSNTNGYVGHSSGSTGTARVVGAGSMWTNSGDLYVSLSGTGTLRVTNGGTVNARTLLATASDLKGNGTINVKGLVSDIDLVFDAAHGVNQALSFGTGGTLNLSVDGTGSLGAGYRGTASITVVDGVKIASDYGYLGYHSGFTGTASVSGAGSKWTNSGYLYVGWYGTGALNITNGGAVSSSTGYLGCYALSSGTATVSGAGSTWTNSSDLYVGGSETSSGGTGEVDINGGGEVSNMYGYLGYKSGSSGTATVSGAGSTWTNSSELRVGYYGTGMLNITAGGAVSNNTFGYLGYKSGSSGTATVSGAVSKWTNSGVLYVGYEGTGTLSITNGGAVSNTTGWLGYGSGSSGTATVNGAGSKWTNSGDLYVGDNGTGTLSILDGGAVSNNTFGYLGSGGSGSSGTATVSGAGSKWTNSYALCVGNTGTGALSILDGGAVSNMYGYMGHWNGSSGTATVSGEGSKWTNICDLYVGYDGTGMLNITAGGAVSNTYGWLGYNSGSSGTATVSGAGSTWTNSRDLRVGYADTGTGTLTVENGGTVNAQTLWATASDLKGNGTINVKGLVSDIDLVFDAAHGVNQAFSFGTGGTLNLSVDGTGSLGAGYRGTASITVADDVKIVSANGYLGYRSGFTGTATVSGAGSKWTNSYDLYVGYSGTGMLSIQNGGAVSTTWGGYLGYGPGSSGTATVSGAGSKWTNSYDLDVGRSGTGTLSILDGGAVSSSTGYLGFSASGSSGTVTVSGAESTWTNSGGLYVGVYGTGVLSITNGGAVSNTYGYLGYFGTASGTATVSGAGSKWTNSGELYVGQSGTGALSITAGGAVSNTYGYLGYSSGISGTATVSGAESKWTNSSYLYVGLSGTGELTITDGGAVSNTYGFLGQYSGSSGTATVSGAGSKWTNAGNLYIGGREGSAGGTGKVDINGGAVNVGGTMKIWNTGTVNLAGGALKAATINHTAGGAFNFTGGLLRVGTFHGNLVNNGGTILPGSSPGLMTVTGDLTMNSGGIRIELAGTARGTGYDAINVTGKLTLAGTLDVVLYGGFMPADGDAFDMLNWGSLTGTFNTVNLPGLSGGLAWDTSDLYNTGEISVILDPATLLGDTNGDGVVDAVDYIAIKTNFGLSGTGITKLQGDLIDNDIVDWADLQELMDQFGTRSVGGAPPAPEPATLGLLAIGAAALLRRRQGYGGQVRRRRARA